MLESCIYEGTVIHHRRMPIKHRFEYRVMMVFLMLEGTTANARPHHLIPARRWGSFGFRREDHLGDPQEKLEESVRDVVEKQTGTRPDGPIGLLTQLRYFGFYFSPLNLYYCFDRTGSVHTVVAEVNNTPWGEQIAYVLWEGNRLANRGKYGESECEYSASYRHPKSMHVSPFMPMEMDYLWQLNRSTDRLYASIVNLQDEEPKFGASISLRRRPLTERELYRALLRYPLMTFKILGAIYWQALRLWWKQCPTYQHPAKKNGEPQPRPTSTARSLTRSA